MSEIPDAVLELVRAHPGLVFVVLLIGAACELLLANDFNEIYYRIGFPVFKTKSPWPVTRELDRRCLDATTVLPNWSLRLAYGKIGPEEFAVREPTYHSWGTGGTGYTPVMHAVLSVDPVTRNVRLVGRTNWSPLVLFAAFFAFLGWTFPKNAEGRDLVFWWLFHTVPFAALLLIYVVQAKIYKALVKEVAAALAQPGSSRPGSP